MLMCDRQYFYDFTAHSVNHIVRKAGDEKSTSRGTSATAGLRMSQYNVGRVLNRSKEATSKSRNRCIVELGSYAELITCGRVELEDHRRRRRSTSANTSAAGTPMTWPLSSSADRRLISSSHASEAPGSRSSMLASSNSASRARSTVGRASNWSASASALRSTTVTSSAGVLPI